MFQSMFGNSRQIQDTLVRKVAGAHASCILSFGHTFENA